MPTDYATRRLHSQISTTILVGLLACGACALLPPRHDMRSGEKIKREFFFSDEINKNRVRPDSQGYSYAEIDTGRLLAECILIVVACGCVLLYLCAKDN